MRLFALIDLLSGLEMKASVAEHVWDLSEVVALIDATANGVPAEENSK
jgi:hypothetical protein